MKAALCLPPLGLCLWGVIHTPGSLWLVAMAGTWVLFGLAITFIRQVPSKAAAILIVLGGIGLPLAASFTPPRSSDDLYRYIWDGHVQSSGVDPYQYPPSDPALAGLRDDFLWPARAAWCLPDGSCTRINRPAVHTIYPPVAQAYFTAVDLLSPRGGRERPIQLAAVLFAVATTVLLLIALPRVGLDPRLAAIWAWCPLVALETGNTAHVDVVGAFLAGAALVAFALRKSALGGALLGLAVATKVTPALIAPAVLRRQPFAVIGAAVGAVVVVYLPHLIAAGPKVLGYIPGYLHEEGYSSGSRFALLTLLMPPAAASVVAVLMLAGAAILVWRMSDPDRPWDSAVVMVGVALLVTTPTYAWYAMLLVLLVAFSSRVEWLAVAIAGYIAQYSANLTLSGVHAQRLGYGLAAVCVIAASVYRLRRSQHVAAPVHV